MFAFQILQSLQNFLFQSFQKMLINKIVLKLENNMKRLKNTYFLIEIKNWDKNMIY